MATSKAMDKVCSVCGREFMGEDPRICGVQCKAADELFIHNVLSALTQPPTGDPRTFFYDAPFGWLVARWAVLCQRRMACRDIAEQQELDFQMSRIKRSIQTKVSIRTPGDREREMLLKLCRELFSMVGRGWWLNGMARNEQYPAPSRQSWAMELLALADRKAATMRQADLLLTGRTHEWRIYG